VLANQAGHGRPWRSGASGLDWTARGRAPRRLAFLHERQDALGRHAAPGLAGSSGETDDTAGRVQQRTASRLSDRPRFAAAVGEHSLVWLIQ
jgi:hypothetical protein